MEFDEIAKNILREDKLMVAHRHGKSEGYINMLLRGDRPVTEETQQIIIDLEFLATQNIALGIYKCEELGIEPELIFH